ncbi:MAG: dihydrofolate reductase [Caldicoprobacterales bacterium]|jgi:dihydrofolate reductase|nr:dihydrofolate reductase [Clostridiales bacterium]
MNFIVAVDRDWNIGKDGALLQPISDDLKQFKAKTLNRVVVLGRKTLQTFPGGKPLAGRTNIILTRQKDFSAEDAIICHSFPELFKLLASYRDDDIFIIGGGEIYIKLIPFCKIGYVTKIHKSYPADTSIINLDKKNNWKLIREDGPHHFKEDIYYSYLEYHNSQVLPMP